MARFSVRYVAGPAGLREAVVEAADAAAVAGELKVRVADIVTLRALDAVPAPRAAARPARAAPVASSRKSDFPLRLFCQELSVLLESGLPLYEAIQTLAEKEDTPATAAVLSAVLQGLEQGQTFAHALGSQPQAFGRLFVASVEASQRTGQIPQALRQHAEYLTWLNGLRDKLVSAAIYPVILIVASLLVVSFLTIFVVPRFAQIYEDMGGELPLLSRWLLNVGQAVGGQPMVSLGVLAGVIGAAVWAWRLPATKALVADMLWRMPRVGTRIRLMELAALYRTLGLLLQAGVTVVPALEAANGLVNPSLRGALQRATQSVREGQRLSDSLQAEDLTTPVSLRMIRTGEHSGELGGMLERAATFYDEELARFTEWVGKVVSPALMLIMGVMIGTIVVLMYLPIFQVAEQIQ
ncbi:MAG: type II secretion system F family protein [Aquabacterium sp.]|nr:MAG: type II secretion system F family protein [Aquabacterium sp.]